MPHARHHLPIAVSDCVFTLAISLEGGSPLASSSPPLLSVLVLLSAAGPVAIKKHCVVYLGCTIETAGWAYSVIIVFIPTRAPGQTGGGDREGLEEVVEVRYHQ